MSSQAPQRPVPRKVAVIAEPRSAQREVRRERRRKLTDNGSFAAAVMVLAALAAVVVANSPAYFVVREVIEAPLGITVGSFFTTMSVESFVNDFLMSLFFLLVGIELKHEMTVGELAHPRQAALPMLAAVGGVAVPACIYLAFNWGGATHGWAIPIATDIAFALGVLSLVGDRVAPATRVFFSTLAIADDILAIIVIAVAYGHTPDIAWLAASLVCVVLLACCNRAHIYTARHYIVVGCILWVCMYNSGIHATLAGVILAFALPARTDIELASLPEWLAARAGELDEVYDEESLVLGQHAYTSAAAEIEDVMHHVTPPLQRVERSLTTFVNFFVLPLFAFINAQVRIVGVDMALVVADPVAQGVFFGAVFGKPIGIIGITTLLVKIGFAQMPEGMDRKQLVAVGLFGGLGFTMSILIAGLAFSDPAEVLAAKCAILAGSVAASALGLIFVRLACTPQDAARPASAPPARER